MFAFSWSHLIILLIVLLLFGARRLPELGASLGEGLRNFKKGLEGPDEKKKDQTKLAQRESDTDSDQGGTS